LFKEIISGCYTYMYANDIECTSDSLEFLALAMLVKVVCGRFPWRLKIIMSITTVCTRTA
jgi:hypothetical protein